ncbi:aspartate ammonia-lyase [Hymenobacter algoricola]|uniref:Aspartate ammonia-lyase n=1 Tax=Hymenobacter algoricola TaxID=486267 RepID=A0ABP7NFI3_9BACT
MTLSRLEHDFLGERALPEQVYYGIQTLRALENFHITGIPIKSEPLFVQALAYVKKAAAMANRDLGVLDPTLAGYIMQACDRVSSGALDGEFLTDMIQGGAGTSVNMNANEVIANVALELMGKPKGQYEFCHPNNHVNCSQSTNDAYPTAFRIALSNKLVGYSQTLGELADAFAAKGDEFRDVLKMGRTQLQDAVPMSMGDEFRAFATNLREELLRIADSRSLISEINMGATAIGTRVNAPAGYAELVTEHLRTVTGLDLMLAGDLIEATYDTGAYVQLSGVLKRTAVKLSKICNDLRLLSSGPRAGLFEINLPALQPGSSIMPGKVNPVVPEVVNQTAFYVIGADLTVTMAAEAGQLQLNVMEPVISFALFTSISYMTNACRTLHEKCVVGITANKEHAENLVRNSIGIVTQLNPVIGYEASAEIAKEALRTGKSVYAIAVTERGLLTQAKWDEIFTFENLIRPGFIQ